MKNTVIYTGTFDPITNGHLDIIQRACCLFDKVIVAVAKNPSKQPMFSLEQRVELVRESGKHLTNLEVIGFSGLLVDFAKEHHANTLIRGIRSSDDVEYEIQLAQVNNQLAGALETIILPPSVEWRHLSSTIVREVYKHHGDIRPFVPEAVMKALANLNQ